MARWRAVVTSQVPGSVPIPVPGQRCAAIANASAAASSARSKTAEAADQAGQHRPHSSRKICSIRTGPYWAGWATTGRISTELPIWAAGIRSASSVA